MIIDIPGWQAWRLDVYVLARITHVTVADSLGSGVKRGRAEENEPLSRRLTN
jgi:hypothetical protein